jgi:hypothetical protein
MEFVASGNSKVKNLGNIEEKETSLLVNYSRLIQCQCIVKLSNSKPDNSETLNLITVIHL